MDFEKVLKQREAMSAAAATETAREKLEESVKPAKRRPDLSISELERQEARSPEQAAVEEAEYQKGFQQDLDRQRAAAQEQLNERRALQERVNDPFEGLRPDGKRKPGPKRQKASKRNDPENWESFTAFVHPSTKKRVGDLVHLAKTAGDFKVGDQSDIMEAALTAYLNKTEKRIKTLIAQQYGEG